MMVGMREKNVNIASLAVAHALVDIWLKSKKLEEE